MPCSINFSMTLQTEILSIETSDFLKQMIILKSIIQFRVIVIILNTKLYTLLNITNNFCNNFTTGPLDEITEKKRWGVGVGV